MLESSDINIVKEAVSNEAWKIVIAIALILWCYNHFVTQHWSGTYYPDKDQKDIRHIESSMFPSKEECDFWGEGEVGNNPNGEFVCGKNCKFNKELHLYSCETLDINGGPDSKDNVP